MCWPLTHLQSSVDSVVDEIMLPSDEYIDDCWTLLVIIANNTLLANKARKSEIIMDETGSKQKKTKKTKTITKKP